MTNINVLLHQLKERMSRAQLSDMDTLASYLVLVLKSIQLVRSIKVQEPWMSPVGKILI